MTKKIILIAATAILLTGMSLAPAAAQANTPTASQPAAPEGFSWYTAKNGVGDFLVPQGWYTKEETQGDTHAMFITREPIPDGGHFTVGLTVNQFPKFLSSKSVKPSEFAKRYATKLAHSGEVLASGVVKGNKSDINFVRVRANHADMTVIVHFMAIGMDAEDKFYVLVFEGPEKEFDSVFALAKPMLNLFALGE